MLKATVVEREMLEIGEGIMRFHDYVQHREDFHNFVDRVMREANSHWKNGECIADVQFVNEEKAIVMWREEE